MKRKLLLLFAILFSMLMVKAQITATFNYSGSIVNWTVPSGIYSVTINAMGASGGNNTAYANNGGRGANMQGTFTVTPGDVLKILVGQAGTASSAPSGGGGSFVATSSNTPLIVAGGGGGAGYSSDYSQATADAPATTSGNGGYDPDRTTESGTGGTGGYGGNPGRLTPGGGGFYGDGVYSASDGSNSVAGLGKSFLNGGAGGASSPTAACFTWVSSPGGFGGGGGAGYAAAGAGGGYSGGGGTSGCNPGTGGGGGSYNSGTSQTNIGGYNYGNGLVTITYASPQIITFNALPAKTYGNTPFTVSATGGASGNPVVFTSSDPTIATCTGTNGTTVTILKAGTVNIIANQAGGGTYAAANPTPQSLVINPITLTVTGATASNKVYDGTTTATISGGTLVGIINSDVVSLATATSGTFSSSAVGTGKTVTSTMTLTGANAGNYTVAQPALTANITAKTLTVTGASGVNKVYNGTTAATITGGTLAGVVGSDAVTLATATSGTFASANVGTGIGITSAMTLTGAAAGNYTLTQPVLSADITPLALTVSGTTAKNKVYNGNVIDTITGATLTGVLNDDIVILNGDTIGTFTQSTVGTNILVTTDMWLSGLNAENYSLPVQPTINANITPLALTISSATANSKTYDGTDTTTIYGVVLSGIVGDDDVTLTGDTVGTFPGPDAGTNLTVTTNINLAGPAAGNYVLAGQPLLFANIDPLPVTVSGAVASNKVYDGNSIDTLKGATLTGILEGDIVTLTGDTLGSFESPNAGKNIQVIVRMGLSGPDAGNYSISQPALSADITPLNITVTGAFATNKVYDGTATDTIWGGTLVGVIDPDIVNLPDSSLGTFANVNVGTGITVTSDIILAGAQAGNYTLAQPSLSADITPLPLSIVAKAENKVYDGTTTDTITGSTLSGIVGSDDVKLTADTLGTFASSNAGTKITVTSNMNLTGAAAGNYSLTQPALSADITPLSLTVTGATAENKVYDGTSTDTIHDGTLTGVIGSDVVTVPPSSTGSFASLNVGTGIVVTSDILLSGSSAGNYTLIQPVLSANITQRPITITANAVSKMKGINDPALTYSITAGNLVGSDEFTGSLTRQPGDTVGKYNIELGTLSAGPDYDITFVPAIFTIEVNTGVLTISDTKPVLYPNPARDYIYIDNLPENTSIFIFNLTGKLIKDNIATSTTGKIDINDIPSGVYIIKLSGTQINTVIRFVKL